MRAATGSQWSLMSSGVTCALFCWLNIRRAAAFWIICSGFTTHHHDTLNERPVRDDSNQECALPDMPILDSMDRRMRWLTVSNAADKSSRTRAEDGASALAVFKASVTDNRAVSVE